MPEQQPQQLVQQEIADNLAIITLHNPDKRNALTHTAFGEVAKSITDAAAERSVRAIVITGAGAHFCSGLDLTAGESLTGASDEQIQTSMGELNAMIRAVVEAEVPVIAAVEGAAAGVGGVVGFSLRLGGSSPECVFRAALRSDWFASRRWRDANTVGVFGACGDDAHGLVAAAFAGACCPERRFASGACRRWRCLGRGP